MKLFRLRDLSPTMIRFSALRRLGLGALLLTSLVTAASARVDQKFSTSATLSAEARAMRRKTHTTIRKVTGDIDPRVQLNTAVSAMMELTNDLYKFADRFKADPTPVNQFVAREAIEALILMLSPFAPHMCEELWQAFGHATGVVAAGWPAVDEGAAKEEAIEIPVQVNGKLVNVVKVPSESDDATIQGAALADEKVNARTAGRTVAKVIVVKGKLVNIVVK